MANRKKAPIGNADAGVMYERHRANERVSIFKDKRKSPFWQLDFWLEGKQYRPSTGTANKKAAVEVAGRKCTELVLGIDAVSKKTTMTVSQGVEHFLTNRKEKRGIAQSTISTYRSNFNDLVGYLQSSRILRCDQIRPEHCDGFEQHLRNKAADAAAAARSGKKKGQPRNRQGRTPTWYSTTRPGSSRRTSCRWRATTRRSAATRHR